MKGALIFWFSGLSGSGKTTIARSTKTLLEADGHSVLILDGDDIRNRLHVDLGFSREDIIKNNSLIVNLCQRYRKNYDIIFVPIISPYKISRQKAKESLKPRFYEVFLKADIELLMKRDTKGLYAQALKGDLKNLIGFSQTSPYESPSKPDIIIDSDNSSIDKSTNDFYTFVRDCLNNQQKLI
jgi:adenylylsulfate kinase